MTAGRTAAEIRRPTRLRGGLGLKPDCRRAAPQSHPPSVSVQTGQNLNCAQVDWRLHSLGIGGLHVYVEEPQPAPVPARAA